MIVPYGNVVFSDGFVLEADNYRIKEKRGRYYLPPAHPRYGGKRLTFNDRADAENWLSRTLTGIFDDHDWDVVDVSNPSTGLIAKETWDGASYHVWPVPPYGNIVAETVNLLSGPRNANQVGRTTVRIPALLYDVTRRAIRTFTERHIERWEVQQGPGETEIESLHAHWDSIPQMVVQTLNHECDLGKPVPKQRFDDDVDGPWSWQAPRFSWYYHEQVTFTSEEVEALRKAATRLTIAGYPTTLSFSTGHYGENPTPPGHSALTLITIETPKATRLLTAGKSTNNEYGHTIKLDIIDTARATINCGFAHQAEQMGKLELRDNLKAMRDIANTINTTTRDITYQKGTK